ncbi:hypothetical protein FB451DRAFT_1389516 [Mycena latifolia]|nr:hypothetical protein FB451DRAFT_1389516 [Mycena latifolia]
MPRLMVILQATVLPTHNSSTATVSIAPLAPLGLVSRFLQVIPGFGFFCLFLLLVSLYCCPVSLCFPVSASASTAEDEVPVTPAVALMIYFPRAMTRLSCPPTPSSSKIVLKSKLSSYTLSQRPDVSQALLSSALALDLASDRYHSKILLRALAVMNAVSRSTASKLSLSRTSNSSQVVFRFVSCCHARARMVQMYPKSRYRPPSLSISEAAAIAGSSSSRLWLSCLAPSGKAFPSSDESPQVVPQSLLCFHALAQVPGSLQVPLSSVQLCYRFLKRPPRSEVPAMCFSGRDCCLDVYRASAQVPRSPFVCFPARFTFGILRWCKTLPLFFWFLRLFKILDLKFLSNHPQSRFCAREDLQDQAMRTVQLKGMNRRDCGIEQRSGATQDAHKKKESQDVEGARWTQ